MRSTTRDIFVGVVSGLVAVGVMSLRGEPARVPPGLYQATIDHKKYREMDTMLRRPTSSTKTYERLRTRIDAPDVEGVAFDRVLAYLADASGVGIEVEWSQLAMQGIERNKAVAARLRGVTVAEALRDVLGSAAFGSTAPLAYIVEGDRLRVSTEEVLAAEQVTRVYDVRDILDTLTKTDVAFLGRRRVPPGALPDPFRDGSLFTIRGESRFDFATTPAAAVAVLQRAIRKDVDGEWLTGPFGGGGGLFGTLPSRGTIDYFAGRLIITQTRPNQDQVAMWLYWLREELKR